MTPPANVPAIGTPTHELRLHDALLGQAERFIPNPRGRLVPFHEFELRHGRPDVVLADLDWDLFEERVAAGITPLPSIAATATVASLRALRGRASADALQTAVSELVGERAARRALQEVRNLDWVVGSDRLCLSDLLRSPLMHRAIAVEAKIGRWREATRQAYRFRGLVDQAWLAFPASYLHRLPDDMPGVRLLGIVGVGAEGEITAMTAPPARIVDRTQSALFEQYLYRRLLRDRAAATVADPHKPRASLAVA